MNVLLCCESYAPSVGGVQEVMRQVAERLAARGHGVTVLTGAHPARPRSATIAGVRVESFRVSGNAVRGMHGEVERYQRALLAGGFDAVLVKAAQQWTFDAMTPVLDRVSARKVFVPCGFSALYERAYREYFRAMPAWLRAFDALVFYSQAYRDIEFARAHGIDRCHVLPNGVDEREFAGRDDGAFRREMGIAAGDLLLLSVGTLVPGKGHWEALRAFALARLPAPATLVINGNDPYRGGAGCARRALSLLRERRMPLPWLARGVERATAGSKRVLVTDLPRPALVRAFQAADLFLFASRVEYSPLVLFETAAAGTPFLSSPAGNAREIARWTSSGWICEAPTDASGRVRVDPPVLAEELERRLADRGALRAAGAEGRRRILAGGFTWEAIVPRYEAILAGREPGRAAPAAEGSA